MEINFLVRPEFGVAQEFLRQVLAGDFLDRHGKRGKGGCFGAGVSGSRAPN
jgi:hypothetical protein